VQNISCITPRKNLKNLNLAQKLTQQIHQIRQFQFLRNVQFAPIIVSRSTVVLSHNQTTSTEHSPRHQRAQGHDRRGIWKAKIRYRVHSGPPQIPVISQLNTIHLDSLLSKLNFNTMLLQYLSCLLQLNHPNAYCL
jgi:hypothetical protein